MTKFWCGAIGVGGLVLGGACARVQTRTAERSAPTPASVCHAYTHQGQASEFHHGVLVYREPPRAMSVDAYRHVEFTLQTSERKLALATSQAVSWEQLHGVRDRDVTLCCVWMAGPTPSPEEAAPIGPDGQPFARPSRCQVLGLVDAP